MMSEFLLIGVKNYNYVTKYDTFRKFGNTLIVVLNLQLEARDMNTNICTYKIKI